jgi:hypothetical protein
VKRYPFERPESDGTAREPDEVLPPLGAEPRAASPPGIGVNPVFAGALLDVIDFLTFGPVGLSVGWLVGGVAAWILSSLAGVPPWQRALWALAAAVYCSLPVTGVLPLGTILGLFLRLRSPRRPG